MADFKLTKFDGDYGSLKHNQRSLGSYRSTSLLVLCNKFPRLHNYINPADKYTGFKSVVHIIALRCSQSRASTQLCVNTMSENH